MMGVIASCRSKCWGGFELKELEVAVGVDGKGRVGFLGTGIDVGAQATITLKFNR
jgi:hypothetical protein